jgi:hypothetical protein
LHDAEALHQADGLQAQLQAGREVGHAEAGREGAGVEAAQGRFGQVAGGR